MLPARSFTPRLRLLRRQLSTTMKVPHRDQLFINNEWVGTTRSFEVTNPATDELLFNCARASESDVQNAVKSARACFNGPDWGKASTGKARGDILRTMGAKLREQKEEFSILESLDNGKPINEARGDIDVCISLFEYFAGFADSFEEHQIEHVKSSDKDFNIRLVKEPAGVIGMVTPWNYPLMQAVVKVAPALAAGCTLVLKPSSVCTATCLRLGDLSLAAGLPPGALNVIAGTGSEAGAALLNSPVDRLSFTGSSNVGHTVMHACADALVPGHLELGGKGAIVVFDDVDVNPTVDWIMVGIFVCAGQSCSATSRLIVHEKIEEKIVNRLLEKIEKLQMGDPLDENTNLGPLTSRDQLRDVSRFVDDAKKEGAEVLCGGSAVGGVGCYYPATILKCDTSSEAWREEIFGPVLAMRTFRTEKEAVALANDTPYGLGNAVICNDEKRCERVAQQLHAGVVWKNCSNAIPVEAPFGGFGKSGFGKEYGALGFEEYVQVKCITDCKPGFSWEWYGSD